MVTIDIVGGCVVGNDFPGLMLKVKLGFPEVAVHLSAHVLFTRVHLVLSTLVCFMSVLYVDVEALLLLSMCK